MSGWLGATPRQSSSLRGCAQDRYEALYEARAPYFACNALQGLKWCLLWLLEAVRPLRTSEMQMALAETRGYNRDDPASDLSCRSTLFKPTCFC